MAAFIRERDDRPDRGQAPIFVHPQTATVPAMRHFTGPLGADRPLEVLLPERPTGRFGTSRSIEEMTLPLLQSVRTSQPSGPYFLAGYSLGGLFAYELATQLTAAGESVGSSACAMSRCRHRRCRTQPVTCSDFAPGSRDPVAVRQCPIDAERSPAPARQRHPTGCGRRSLRPPRRSGDAAWTRGCRGRDGSPSAPCARPPSRATGRSAGRHHRFGREDGQAGIDSLGDVPRAENVGTTIVEQLRVGVYPDPYRPELALQRRTALADEDPPTPACGRQEELCL